MGHTGSVQRGPHGSRHANPNGALYGEPLGSHPAGAVNHANYTPAQLQALYLSRGRPDMGFMSNQAMVPKDVPEMQQTSTVKNHVNLKKSSLKLAPIESSKSSATPNLVSLEFQFDAAKPCRVTVFLVALEEIDDDTGCSRYSQQHKDAPSLSCDFPEGLSQKFSLIEHVAPSLSPVAEADDDASSVEELFDLSRFNESELIYVEGSLKFPLIIVLEVLESDGVGDKSPAPQSQSTFCTFAKQPNGTSVWAIKMLKQKIQVDGLTYELQEIYGIDGSLAAAPKNDSNGDNATGEKKGGGGALDEVEMPDGAECIICMCEPRNTTVLPCRHMCLCGECAEALRKSSSTCPICRTHVEGLLQIRVDAKDQSNSKS
ncbi:Ring zinc finger-like protein [Globisporangium polare]